MGVVSQAELGLKVCKSRDNYNSDLLLCNQSLLHNGLSISRTSLALHSASKVLSDGSEFVDLAIKKVLFTFPGGKNHLKNQ